MQHSFPPPHLLPRFLDPAHGRLGYLHERRRALRRAPRVLVLSEDAAIRGVLAIGLYARGVVVLTAADVEEALTVCRTATSVEIVLTDMEVPGSDGVQAVAAIRRVAPWVRACVMATPRETGLIADLPDAEAILKPVKLDDLARQLWRLARKPLARVG